jgi:transposase
VKQIRDKVAGIDVHRDTVVACCRVGQPDRSVDVTKQSFATTAKGLAELASWLTEAQVITVAMEATGVYWKPVYYALEGLFDELWLCNAQHVKNVPGRKTELSDAEWLADVASHGMVRPSFVPPSDIRELRELTRYRKTQVDARDQEIQRLEKVLQDAGIKLSSVASTVWGASSRLMIEAMIEGERDPKVLGQMAKGAPGQDLSTRGGLLGALRVPPCPGLSPSHRPHRFLGPLHRHPDDRDHRAALPFLRQRSPSCARSPGCRGPRPR